MPKITAKPLSSSERQRRDKDKNKDNEDIILSLTNKLPSNYMDQICSGAKTYEFRRYALKIKRAWFYVSAPLSQLKYICEIEAMPKRGSSDWEPLAPSENGENQLFNDNHESFRGYDYAYKILTVYELLEPLTLRRLKDEFGITAPQGWRYLPKELKDIIDLQEQLLVRENSEKSPGASAPRQNTSLEAQ